MKIFTVFNAYIAALLKFCLQKLISLILTAIFIQAMLVALLRYIKVKSIFSYKIDEIFYLIADNTYKSAYVNATNLTANKTE